MLTLKWGVPGGDISSREISRVAVARRNNSTMNEALLALPTVRQCACRVSGMIRATSFPHEEGSNGS